MRAATLSPAFQDERGAITDLVDEPVQHVALMTCSAGSVRGNHYHRTATAYVYVLRGRFRVTWRNAEAAKPSELTATAGDLLTILPGERHALEALEPSEFLMMVSSPGAGRHWQGDTVRDPV